MSRKMVDDLWKSTTSVNEDHSTLFEKQLLTYKQAAQYLGLSEPYLRRLKQRRLIGYVQVGDRGVRFRISSLNKWIESREVKCRRES